MNKDETTLDLIDQYLDNKLDAVAKEEVENRLLSDPSFKETLNSRISVRKLITYAGRAELRKVIAGFEDTRTTSVKITTFQRTFLIAAMLVVCVGLGIWFLTDSNVSTSSLYASNYEQYRGPVITRDSQNNQTWADVSVYYNQEKYDEALKLLQDPVLFDQAHYLVQFYTGICIISNSNSKDDAEAAAYFRTVLKTGNDYTQQSEWYLGLLYLKLADINNAQTIFEGISRNDRHYKKEQAKEIISEFW